MRVLITEFSAITGIFRFIALFIVFIVVLVLAFYFTKWYANSGLVKKGYGNIQIVESYQLAPGKIIYIVRIGSKFVSIVTSKDNIVKLTELSEEDIELNSEGVMPDASFKEVMGHMIKSKKMKDDEKKMKDNNKYIVNKKQNTVKKHLLNKSVLNIFMMLCACVIIFSASMPAYVRATAPGIDRTTQGEIAGEPDTDDNTLDLNISSNAGSTNLEATLQILIMLTILSLAPSILIMVTSFTRIIVVLHFIRTALATQTSPPNQVLVGLALFITLAVMAPVFNEVNTNAIQPFMSGEVKQEQAFEAGTKPLKEFMLKETRDKDLQLFIDINGTDVDTISSYEDLPITVVIPAFIISELRTAFIIGFVLYLPFIVVDMVVAATLMSMGMMMLPPTTISMPFKILLFIMADGWNLVIGQLVNSFK